MAEEKKAAEEAPQAREEGELSPNKDGEPDFSKKHALEHRWTLWFDNPSGKQSLSKYGQGLRSVYSFDTVEDFWWCVCFVLLQRWDGLAARPSAFSLSLLSTHCAV